MESAEMNSPISEFFAETSRGGAYPPMEWRLGARIFWEFYEWTNSPVASNHQFLQRQFYDELRSLGYKDRVECSKIEFLVPIKKEERDWLFIATRKPKRGGHNRKFADAIAAYRAAAREEGLKAGGEG